MIRKLLIVQIFIVFLTACNGYIDSFTSNDNKMASKVKKQTVTESKGNKVTDHLGSSGELLSLDYAIKTETYHNKGVSIKYPQIIMTETGRKNRINKIIKTEAFSVMQLYQSNDSIEIKYIISLQSTNVLSIKYYRVGFSEGAAYPLSLLYTVNIDLHKGSKLRMSDIIKINRNFVESFKKYKVKEPLINQASVSAFNYILESSSEEDLIQSFKGADSSYNHSPYVFSYLTKDALGISIEVPNAVGDHFEIELKFQDIKDNIESENVIWKDISFSTVKSNL